MTAGRLACIIATELHAAGFLNTAVMNEPTKVIEAAINRREKFGDVQCTPDEQERSAIEAASKIPFFHRAKR